LLNRTFAILRRAELGLPFCIIIYRPFFPPIPSHMKIFVCLFDFGFWCNKIRKLKFRKESISMASCNIIWEISPFFT
ncbi:hypothetical protein BAE44_0022577, partial [Dichanthelium oligosanthes]